MIIPMGPVIKLPIKSIEGFIK